MYFWPWIVDGTGAVMMETPEKNTFVILRALRGPIGLLVICATVCKFENRPCRVWFVHRVPIAPSLSNVLKALHA